MRLMGWLASAVGLTGIVVSNGIASLVWALKINLQGRAHELIGVPDAGLERAIELTATVASRLGDASAQIGEIRAKADALAGAADPDAAAATDLATVIDDFITGPYANFRIIYTALRERAATVGDALQGLGRAIPTLTLPGVVVERLQAIDARLEEIEAAITRVAGAGAAGLAEPGAAARVSEAAGAAQERLDTIGELVTDFGGRMQETRERLVERDRQIARLLTVGAIAGSIVSLFVAGLNVLLFQQGRRWSRR